MNGTRAYLDHAASAPLLPAAREAIAAALELTGNPSSVHAEGRALRHLVETARDRIAGLAGADRKHVVFTGSATEAITQAIAGGSRALGIDEIVVSAGEHSAVLKAAEMTGLPVHMADLDAQGRIDAAAIAARLDAADADNRKLLVAVHAVNNETGVVQPLEVIEALVGPSRHVLFVDAVQAFGKRPIAFDAGAADMMAVSAHKIGGPAGVGALLMKPHCDAARLVPGGGQEQNRRGGTESVALIAGFGAAADAFPKAFDGNRLGDLARRIEDGVAGMSPDAVVFGAASERIGTISNFAVPGLTAAVGMMSLDLEGVAVSSGSACSSGKVGRSHVLAAMGVAPALADCALRASLGWSTSEGDVEAFLTAYGRIAARRAPQKGRAA